MYWHDPETGEFGEGEPTNDHRFPISEEEYQELVLKKRDQDRKEEQADRVIAYQGQFEILDASWSIHSGRMMELRVVERDDMPDMANPFKKFRKSGEHTTGTRFRVNLWKDGTGEDLASDVDCILKAWGEAYDRGQWVRFTMDEELDRHPLHGLTARFKEQAGTKIFGVFFEIDDDEKVIDQRHRRMKPSQYAHLLCFKNELFLMYLSEQVRINNQLRDDWTGERAKEYVKWKLALESFSQLDRSVAFQEKMYKAIREPFERWRGRA